VTAPGRVVIPAIPRGWPGLASERDAPYFQRLGAFLQAEYAAGPVYPPAPELFEALRLTPLRNVRAVVLGQDPYHQPGQAHGLAFSVRAGVKPPPSLRNLFRELHDDTGLPTPGHGHLSAWARQGVLLLNTVLSVRHGEPGSHAGQGWELFTDAVIEQINRHGDRVVFLLLGSHARKKLGRIDGVCHAVIEAPHPSPLSARRGFFGSRIYSRTNVLLEEAGRGTIDWRVGDAKRPARQGSHPDRDGSHSR
jgi:uracil-DNA glycosylase